MTGRTREPGTGPDAGTLLRVAEHFLRRRHFDDCRKYAHQALQTDPELVGVNEILAVADVLIASKPRSSGGDLTDWYAVLQLNRYSHDSNLLRQRFNQKYAILNPTNNRFPLADEAFDLVCEAWYVLSNPLKKCEYDDSLRKHFDGEKLEKRCGFSLWTVCPYCYYLYEYPRVYLECCLRCPNAKCEKAFTCVEIDEPPVEVLREGKYLCAGFLPVGIQGGGWNPFSPLKNEKENASNDQGGVVEISDDDDGDDDHETETHNSCNASAGGANAGEGSVKVEAVKQPEMKDVKRKKKSVAKNTKKVTGTGNRVVKQGFASSNDEETELDEHWGDDDDGGEFGFGFSGGDVDMKGEDVQYYDGDDDILVSLQNSI